MKRRKKKKVGQEGWVEEEQERVQNELMNWMYDVSSMNEWTVNRGIRYEDLIQCVMSLLFTKSGYYLCSKAGQQPASNNPA